MKLKLYSGEPCGSGNFPPAVLMPDGFNIPMLIALSTDKKTLLLMDCVDYYKTKNLTKDQAFLLANEFMALAMEMQ